MKIEVNERGSNQFYQEFMYVYFKYKLLKNKPNKKVHSLINYLLFYISLVVFELFLITYLYISDKDNLYIFFIGVFSILLIYLLNVLLISNKQIKLIKNEKGKKIIVINKNGITYTDDNKQLKLNWNDIATIIINKYTICFLPKEQLQSLISLSIDYKEQVLEEVYKYNKENLVTDNSNLYRKK